MMADTASRERVLSEPGLAARVFETSLHAIVILSADCKILCVNEAFSAITGYPATEVVGRNLSSLRSCFMETGFLQRARRSLLAVGKWQGETRLRARDGTELTLRQCISSAVGTDGRLQAVIAVFEDVTEQRLARSQLHQLAHFDNLTKLPNRRTLSEQIQRTVDAAVRCCSVFAVFLIDIDRFKAINDSLGHEVGDQVLQAAAVRLRACLPEGSMVARIGNDEFVVLLAGTGGGRAEFERVARKLVSALEEPVLVNGYALHVSACISISMFPQDGWNGEVLLRSADTAMYAAKAAGRGSCSFFDESMARQARRRLELDIALRNAIGRGELALHYQPQYTRHASRPSGVEALLRWNRPHHGMVLPLEFIPLAEEGGLIIPIGTWVLESACAQAAQWLAMTGIRMRIAVNVSARQIHHPGFVGQVRDTLARTGLPPELLELEITENSIVQNLDESVNKLRQIKALGVTIAIDDFGTGYSSLSYLKLLPIDRLKIDRSFVKDTPHDANGCALVRTIISMSKSLNLSVIAEGVETVAQASFLEAEACDEMQGYLLSRPLPAAALHRLLNAHSPGIDGGADRACEAIP